MSHLYHPLDWLDEMAGHGQLGHARDSHHWEESRKPGHLANPQIPPVTFVSVNEQVPTIGFKQTAFLLRFTEITHLINTY